MPTYQSPGVYVEEVPSAVRPIAGVGTSTAGFIGLVRDNVTMPFRPGRPLNPATPVPDDFYLLAPANRAQLITGWEDFKNTFGNVQDGNWLLANAVYGFFNNGGTRCWVTRVNDLTVSTTTPPVDRIADALAEFEGIDEIALVAVPLPTDTTAGDDAADRARRVQVRELVLSHCERMQDRFAILDGEEVPASPLTPATVYTNAANNGMGRTSNYGAVYFPWIDVTGDGRYVPPSGHIAGIYARVDATRGVHKAPANEVIRGALGARLRVSKAQQNGLNPQGINVLRQFDGNITVWGARTIGGDANGDFKYVNVRRLLIFLRESIDNGTRWVVFEPNDMSLWAKITRNVTAFLTNVWRGGAPFGNTPAEAFYVKCDAETNPPEVRALGQVVTEIGVAVVKPAEFVLFRISQWGGPSE